MRFQFGLRGKAIRPPRLAKRPSTTRPKVASPAPSDHHVVPGPSHTQEARVSVTPSPSYRSSRTEAPSFSKSFQNNDATTSPHLPISLHPSARLVPSHRRGPPKTYSTGVCSQVKSNQPNSQCQPPILQL